MNPVLPLSIAKSGAIRHRNGFTLVELIVSMTILGLVVSVLYGSLHVGLKSVDTSESKSEVFQRIRITREILTGVLRSAYLTPSSSDWTVFIGEEFFGKGEAGKMDEGKIAFLGENDQRDGRPHDRLHFNSLMDYPDGSRILTSIHLDFSEDRNYGGRDLLLVRKPRFGPWEPDTVRLIQGIQEIDIRYLRTDDMDEPEWLDEWDSESELPEAIEINMSWEQETETELRVAYLPLLLYLPGRPVR